MRNNLFKGNNKVRRNFKERNRKKMDFRNIEFDYIMCTLSRDVVQQIRVEE